MVLVMVAGTVSVAHSHRDSNALDEHGTCGLCVTAHAVAQVATPSAQIAVALVYEPFPERAPLTRTRTFSGTAHFTRPPPAAHLS